MFPNNEWRRCAASVSWHHVVDASLDEHPDD